MTEEGHVGHFDGQNSDLEEKHGHSWVEIVFICWIILKITMVCAFLLTAVLKYYKRYSACSIIGAMLACYVAMLITTLIMDFTAWAIPVAFTLIMIANYFNLVGFWKILTNLPAAQRQGITARAKAYYYIMNLMYVGILVLIMVPGYSPICREDRKYPTAMYLAEFLFVINYGFHIVILCNYERLLKKEEHEAFFDDMRENFGSQVLERRLTWSNQMDQKEIRRQMFDKQFKRYVCFTSILMVVLFTALIWGHSGSYEHLICSESGYTWEEANFYSMGLEMFHFMQVMMQGVMLCQVFYNIPKDDQLFETDLKGFELGRRTMDRRQANPRSMPVQKRQAVTSLNQEQGDEPPHIGDFNQRARDDDDFIRQQ